MPFPGNQIYLAILVFSFVCDSEGIVSNLRGTSLELNEAKEIPLYQSERELHQRSKLRRHRISVRTNRRLRFFEPEKASSRFSKIQYTARFIDFDVSSTENLQVIRESYDYGPEVPLQTDEPKTKRRSSESADVLIDKTKTSAPSADSTSTQKQPSSPSEDFTVRETTETPSSLDTTTESPFSDTSTGIASVASSTSIPSSDTTTESPSSDTSTESPFDSSTQSSSSETTTESPSPETTADSLLPDSTTESPSSDTTTKSPSSDTTTNTPSPDTTTESSPTDSSTESPSLDTTTETPSSGTTTEKPSSGTSTTESPPPDTSTESPSVTTTNTSSPDTTTGSPSLDTKTETPSTTTESPSSETTDSPSPELTTKTPSPVTSTENPSPETTESPTFDDPALQSSEKPSDILDDTTPPDFEATNVVVTVVPETRAPTTVVSDEQNGEDQVTNDETLDDLPQISSSRPPETTEDPDLEETSDLPIIILDSTTDLPGFFNLSDCDSYRFQWLVDLAETCEESDFSSLIDCECGTAEALLQRGDIACPGDDTTSAQTECPEACTVCSICLQIICDTT